MLNGILNDKRAEKLPIFAWSTSKKSPSGIPLLNIIIPNEDPDAAILNFSSLSDHENSNSNCILEGHLRDDSDVFVTLTGGCPFSMTFEVSRLLVLNRYYTKHTHFYSGFLSLVFQMNTVSGFFFSLSLSLPYHYINFYFE
jgi:hypothetical protein